MKKFKDFQCYYKEKDEDKEWQKGLLIHFLDRDEAWKHASKIYDIFYIKEIK